MLKVTATLRRTASTHNVSKFRPPNTLYRYNTRRTYVVETIQSYLINLQSVTTLPWYLTIALSTIMVRTSLLPLVRQQLIASRKLSNAIPEINFLYQLLRNRLRLIPLKNHDERIKIFNVFLKGVKACLVLHDVKLMQLFLNPIINFSMFFSFVYSVRDIVLRTELMDNGGIIWFKDLSMKDSTFFLPLASVSASYLALEIAFGTAQGKFILLVKDIAQSLLLISIPGIVSLPAGVFCYWLPTSFFSMIQSIALRNPKVLNLLKLPPVKNISKSGGKSPPSHQ